MSGPIFVIACAAFVFTLGQLLDGEEKPMQKLFFALYALGGYAAFGAWIYYYRELPGGVIGLLVLFCFSVAAWGYRLDTEGRIGRIQRTGKKP